MTSGNIISDKKVLDGIGLQEEDIVYPGWQNLKKSLINSFVILTNNFVKDLYKKLDQFIKRCELVKVSSV